MPPRYAYWTILVDGQATAFRAASQEDLMPTFNRLKEKHPSAVMQWFQNGKLWPSRVDAQEAMRARGEMGRRGDSKQAGGFRERSRSDAPKREYSDRGTRPRWSPKTEDSASGTQDSRPKTSDKLDWKPKGEFTPAPKRSERPFRSEKPDWKPKGSFDRGRKPEWKPKGPVDRERKPEWKPKGSFDRERKPDWKPKSFDRDRKPAWQGRDKNAGANFRSPARGRKSDGEKLDWKPKGEFTPAPKRSERPEWKPKGEAGAAPREKRAWVPKEEYKKSLGIEVPRDSKWRPGGAHRDPKQKYKDAKKAKWSKFKKTIRSKWEAKGKKKS